MIRLLSRKFLLAMALLAMASLLVVFDHITALIWRDAVIVICGGYMTANVVQKATAKDQP